MVWKIGLAVYMTNLAQNFSKKFLGSRFSWGWLPQLSSRKFFIKEVFLRDNLQRTRNQPVLIHDKFSSNFFQEISWRRLFLRVVTQVCQDNLLGKDKFWWLENCPGLAT